MVANLSYSDVFEQRGRAYHQAMTQRGACRELEFAALFARYPLTGTEHLLDLPAGGGYLTRFVPAGTVVTPRELTAGFGAGVPVVDPAADWHLGPFDRVVCLAALHHIADQAGFVRKLRAQTRPGGVLHLADVGTGSGIGRFLDDFVGAHNGTGHRGRYLPERVDLDLCGGAPLFWGERACPWRFADENDLVGFCMGLFGLQGCSPDALLQALAAHVGVTTQPGGLTLNWRLTYVDIAGRETDA